MRQKCFGMVEMLLLLGIGILFILRPLTSLRTVVIISGMVLLLNGILYLLGYFSEREERTPLNLGAAVLLLLLGAWSVFFPDSVESIFAILCAFGFACGGLSALVRAFDERKMGRSSGLLQIIFALLLIALAVVIFINPFSAAVSFTRVLGWLLAISGGCGLIMLFLGQRE